MHSPGSMTSFDQPFSTAGFHLMGDKTATRHTATPYSTAGFHVMGDRTTTRHTATPAGFLRPTRPTATHAGFLRPSSKVSPRTTRTQNTTSRTNWRQFSDDVGDVATAMAAVEMALKNREKGREPEDLKSSMEEADRRIAEEIELEVQESQQMVRQGFERERAITKLRSAMKKCNLKSLKKAINTALELEVPESIVSEAQTLWRLENQLRMAVATADFPEIRKAVEEVERGRQLATFPQEPPFAYQQALQYWSDRREAWVDCHVTQVSPDDGKILINLKKKAGHWFNLHQQHERFRVPEADLAAAAPHARILEAKSLLGKADSLIDALKSEDVERVQDALYEAGAEEALQPLISSAEKFIRRAFKCRAEFEAARRSDEAFAWHKAKQSVQAALQAELDLARSGAEGKGWDSLESDLLVERLEALEKSFDEADVNFLEASIARLEAEELAIPREVTKQAQEALAGLRNKHAELEKSISIGDTDGINTSLELAAEHLLPEDLINQAGSVRDAVDALSTAMSSRDEELLKRALWKVEKDFPMLPQVEQVRGVITSISKFQESLQRDDVKTILATLEIIDKSCMPEVLLLRAEAVEKLALALKAEERHLMEEAVRLAHARALPDALLEQAQLEFEELMSARHRKEQEELQVKQTRALQDFQNAMQGDNLALRKRAFDIALECGVPQAELDKLIAEDRSNRVNAVLDAMRGNDSSSVEEALQRAREYGVPEDVLSSLVEEDQERVTESLKAALLADDFDTIEAAFQNAEGRLSKDLNSEVLKDLGKQRATKRLTHIFQGNDVAAIEEALRDAEQQGVWKDVLEDFSKQFEELRAKKAEERKLEEEARLLDEFRASLENVPEDSISALRAAMHECQKLGLEVELVVLGQKLERELNRRMEKAKEERAKHEKLAAEFKDAKEAQDFGGGLLVAQWRAAVAEIAKPLAISEED